MTRRTLRKHECMKVSGYGRTGAASLTHTPTHPLTHILILILVSATLKAEELSQVIFDLRDPKALHLSGAARVTSDGPKGGKTLRVDGKFAGRIDLAGIGIDSKQYDLIKFEAKTPRGAFLRLSLENYPNEGELSHWYVFDGTRGPSKGWKTVWVDLRYMEEIKLPGKYKGMAAKDPTLRGLPFMGLIVNSRRAIQEPERTMWIRKVRFVKKAIDLDWDQINFKVSWGKGKNLVYTYPVTVRNLLAKPVTVKLSLIPFDAIDAKGAFAKPTVALKAKETKTVAAKVWLGASAAERAAPLHCERFMAKAEVAGIADSDVTILRSADPIHLNVTVPIPEERLALPFYPRLKNLPKYVFNGWDQKRARLHADKLSPDMIDQFMDPESRHGSRSHIGVGSAGEFNQGMGSAAFLYAFTGEKQYFEKLRAVFKRYAEVYSKFQQEDRKKKYRLVSGGIMAGNVLQFGFKFGGSQRPPYYYSTGGNGRFGSLFGHMHAFDLIGAELPARERRFIIKNLFVPAIIQARNHYFGLGNQQCTSNAVTLYGAILARHWPIAGFAYSAEHGLLGNLKWTFDDDGLCREGHYQEYTINPILHATELLYGCGIDLYQKRLRDIIHSEGARAIGKGYRYNFARFVDENRFAGKPFMKDLDAAKTDGKHLSASTLLIWKELTVAMNWGTYIMRGSHDFCSLAVRVPRRPKDRSLNCFAIEGGLGGGSYNHSTFGQSTIIVDEQLQRSEPARVTGFDIVGPVQFVQAESDKFYKGSKITRTFALLEKTVLVVDRVVNRKPRMVDWTLKNGKGKTSIALKQVNKPLTTKPDDNSIGVTYGTKVKEYQSARTSGSWTGMNGALRMLGGQETEVIWGRWSQHNRNVLMARRRNVKKTDFITTISNEVQKLERLPVKKAKGGKARAVGLEITFKNGKTCHAIVNYEPKGTEVVLGSIKTKERFATDCEAK